jgi:4-hydroxybenzoate polyprenyltransferase
VAVALIAAASVALYCGGMVWNDVFDVEQDRRERPFRPIPSGAISPTSARRLGIGLLTTGWFCAVLAGLGRETFNTGPPIIALLLVAAILLYDRWLKRTPAGPLGMGACRFLNVLLSCSVADATAIPWGLRFHLAIVVGLYIVGVTWFARSEARESDARHLRRATGVMLVVIMAALPLPLHADEGTASPFFPYLLVIFSFVIGLPALRAVTNPEPARVQSAVKKAVLGLVALDAILATAIVGTIGLVLLVLLPPALILGKWLYST